MEHAERSNCFTRRTALARLAALGGMTILPTDRLLHAAMLTKEDSDFFAGDQLYRDVVAYSDIGEHRTGTKEDKQTCDWLASELKKVGYKTKLHPYTLRQFFVEKVSLKAGGKQVDCFPMWPPLATEPTPLRAPLVKTSPAPNEIESNSNLRGGIALVEVPTPGASITERSGHTEIVNALVKAGAVGAVAVTVNAQGQLMALNSMRGPEPWPIPIVLVGSKDVPHLEKVAKDGSQVELLIEGKDDPNTVSHEVEGKMERGKDVIVISTPSSGWFRCAGERGPGIALWLALARWVAARDTDVSYTFVASSAHELHGLGIQHYVEKLAPPPETVCCWLHLGAGIATYEYEETPEGAKRTNKASTMRRLMATYPEVIPQLRKNFGELRGLQPRLLRRPVGEGGYIGSKGYKVWTIAGGSGFHHMPGDFPELITGPELLEPVARAVAKTLKEIEAE